MSILNSHTKYQNVFFLFVCLIAFSLFNPLKAEEIPLENTSSDTTAIRYHESFQLKSESHAFKSSLWATVGPLPTLYFAIPGLVFGPSLGYFYAGMPGRAWRGIGIRSAGVVGMVGAIAWSFEDFSFTDDNSSNTGAGILFFTSAGVLIFSAVYDIATVKKALRNKKASMLQSKINILPKYYTDSKSFGIGLKLRF